MNIAPLPDWELVLSSAARLQRILPDAVLVGGPHQLFMLRIASHAMQTLF
ncbi:MAG TPA: hypothetical protein VIM63_08540 [Rhodoferax sp.]